MTEENKEKLILRIEMWDHGDDGVKASYILPHITGEQWIEFYQVFFENLCEQIAQVPGAELLYGLVGPFGEEENEEGEDQS